MITSTKIFEIANKIVERFNPDKIILIGSYASDSYTDDSDVDLLIVQETDLPKHIRSFDIQKFLIGSMIPMDILIYTKTEFESALKEKYSFLNSSLKTSKVLYERK